MATTKREDFDRELAAWIDAVKGEQTERLADLWLANGDAKAIKDPTSPAAEAAHREIDRLLTDLGW